MSAFVYFVCAGIVGLVLGSTGITVLTWQFWVILVAVFGMIITSGKE
jgi:hypothetical protein